MVGIRRIEPQRLSIGDVARRTGVTERTLRYYEELGLLTPARDAAGRRRYDSGTLDRLYRVRLLRELGTPLAAVDPDADDLRELTRRHLRNLDARLADLARVRERVRAVEDRLLHGDHPNDEVLLDLLSGLPVDEPAVTGRITLLVYRDIAAGHAYLVEVLGLAPGPLAYDGDRVIHGEVHAGDGVVWLHREAPDDRMVSPLTHGTVTASHAGQEQLGRHVLEQEPARPGLQRLVDALIRTTLSMLAIGVSGIGFGILLLRNGFRPRLTPVLLIVFNPFMFATRP